MLASHTPAARTQKNTKKMKIMLHAPSHARTNAPMHTQALMEGAVRMKQRADAMESARDDLADKAY